MIEQEELLTQMSTGDEMVIGFLDNYEGQVVLTRKTESPAPKENTNKHFENYLE